MSCFPYPLLSFIWYPSCAFVSYFPRSSLDVVISQSFVDEDPRRELPFFIRMKKTQSRQCLVNNVFSCRICSLIKHSWIERTSQRTRRFHPSYLWRLTDFAINNWNFPFIFVMLLPENLSPIFSSKSKSTVADGLVATKSAQNIVEHDVTGLAKMSNLPAPDAFEALQISSDR